MAFYAGKASNNLATLDNFAASLDDLQLNVQHLEQELAKKLQGLYIRRDWIAVVSGFNPFLYTILVVMF